MSTTDDVQQIEANWDELVREPNRFAGKRVRVTVLPQLTADAEDFQRRVREFFALVDSTQSTPPTSPPTEFEQALMEKYRAQGLVF